MVELIEDDAFNARFPADRLSRVVMETVDGRSFDSGEVYALWDLREPPHDEALLAKFRELVRTHLSEAQTAELEQTVWHIEEMDQVSTLVKMLAGSGMARSQAPQRNFAPGQILL